MKIDIDRLHDVVTEKIGGRGCDKTFAKLHEIAGLIGVGEKVVFGIIERMQDVNHIRPMLFQIMEEHGIGIKQIRQNEFMAGDSRIIFALRSQPDKMRGIKAAVVVVEEYMIDKGYLYRPCTTKNEWQQEFRSEPF